MKAIYPGSFDPITNGHLDILDRSLKLFDQVTIVVAGTDLKTALMPAAERVALIQDVVASRKNVNVVSWPGLIMDYAHQNGIKAVVRGLRAASDFEYEFMMASMNRNLNAEVETVFIMSSQNLYFVSSTMVKELFRYGGDITPYVPPEVLKELRSRVEGAHA